MSAYFENYLKRINFKKRLEYLNKTLKDKRIILYGAGTLLHYIKENYDLSKLNIIGISDKKFSEDIENQKCEGYKIICPENMIKYNPDCILFSVENYYTVMENLQINMFKETDIKLLPLAQKPLIETLRKIWNLV
jgi:hypothetical protein